ncbi:MAG TPA: hypothetical protein VIJ48_02950 [Acidimicrobiia bacterium]
MEEFRWVNPHQPQTLYMGVILSYVQGVFAVLNYPILGPWAFVILVGLVAGGFGIANEKKWGYFLAVGTAVLQVAVVIGRGSSLGNLSVLIELGFDVALVVLLTHPMSRSYQRIWFK